jgi:hypothetical protein
LRSVTSRMRSGVNKDTAAVPVPSIVSTTFMIQYHRVYETVPKAADFSGPARYQFCRILQPSGPVLT